MESRKITHAEWKREGTEKFGQDIMEWRFVCPPCHPDFRSKLRVVKIR